MRWSKSLTLIGAHAEGEIGRVVTGGVLDVPGASTLEKLGFLNRERGPSFAASASSSPAAAHR